MAMNCTHCGKRLSRKSARLIDGVVMCSKCMFTPAKQRKTIAVDRNPKGQDRNGLGAQHESANSSEYYMNTLETTMTPNETSPVPLAMMTSLIEQICIHSNGDWSDGRKDPNDTLDRIHTWAVQAFYDELPKLSAIPTPPPAAMTDSLGRTDADLLRLIAKDHERLAPNSYHSAECLRQIADRLQAHASPREVE